MIFNLPDIFDLQFKFLITFLCQSSLFAICLIIIMNMVNFNTKCIGFFLYYKNLVAASSITRPRHWCVARLQRHPYCHGNSRNIKSVKIAYTLHYKLEHQWFWFEGTSVLPLLSHRGLVLEEVEEICLFILIFCSEDFVSYFVILTNNNLSFNLSFIT